MLPNILRRKWGVTCQHNRSVLLLRTGTMRDGEHANVARFVIGSCYQHHTFLPTVNGRYRYLIMCLICRFMVTTKSSNQYINSMGQNTGTSNIVKKVINRPIQIDLIDDHLQDTTARIEHMALWLPQL
eukprot:GHRR01033490.1.p1 GENE.GHRR01033490.1~~GHRR01033490.1.p1  ORF type:complete len:128 (-),score=28.51 GHRR01033490.1:193-576(-)